MAGLIDKYAFRDEITSGFVNHLLGPGSVEENLSTSPLDVYSVGMLFPVEESQIEVQVDDIAIAKVNDEENEEVASLANLRFPSSMGLTFAVNGDERCGLVIEIHAATYEYSGVVWCRKQNVVKISDIDLKPTVGFEKRSITPGLDLRFRVRAEDVNGNVAVTLVLVNTNPEVLDRKLKAQSVFFQPRIIVEIDSESVCDFVDRSQISNELDDRDSQLSRLLYRHTKNYATGHGCAVEWEDSGSSKRLQTTFLPRFDLKLAESNPSINSWALDMRSPAIRSKPELLNEFSKLVDGYEDWIREQDAQIVSLPISLRDIAKSNIDDCFKSVSRMRLGLNALEDERNVIPFKAFMYMSQAMVEQRIRSEIVLAGRTDVKPDEIPAIWRPFQLMFILQCLSGLVHPESEDREIADLLWFPTGGGKTEAYLGLIAFTFMQRRLDNRSHGVSAIMRYTLRLLTTQQFERAALLMCCCENIRRNNVELGADPFEVGLYVGRSGTPNSLVNAQKALEKLRNNPNANVSKLGNPIQINICVWCGCALGAFDHTVGASCLAKCPSSDCDFSTGLPWLVVDEDIYSRRPNLVIGTVDKFALLATNEKAGRLFNRDLGLDAGIDLIIQDELHLISGPLGTLTGLYEAAIDELGRIPSRIKGKQGPRPKIVASSATIRRATEQVRAVFDRDVCQFPPSALDSRDSYFAVESPAERKGTRRYIGVIAPGLSQATLLVRTYASIFHQTTLGKWGDDVRDTYWTLVAYFNSLRILASSQLLMQDDVVDRLELISGGASQMRKPDENLIELTSRATASDIPKYLRQLRIGLPDVETVETLLATNMISVGVDIDRLGTMVIAGQPQGTAEYIQASSRVGRRDPGLVFTIYNASRSRDRSHFETFLPYHSALYRRVEATSVTPFSPRSRERALHSCLVILCRFLIPGLTKNGDAKNVQSFAKEVEEVKQLLISRVERVDPLEKNDTNTELESFIQSWKNMAEDSSSLIYYKTQKQKENVLLVSFEDYENGASNGFPVLTSMRDVDKTSSIYEISGRPKRVAG